MRQEQKEYNGKAIVIPSKFQGFLLMFTQTKLPIQAKEGKANVQNLSSSCASCIGCYSAVIVAGKIWKGDIAECIWKEQYLFASKRKQKTLSLSFFSSLISLGLQVFLFQHLNGLTKITSYFSIPARKRLLLWLISSTEL